MIWRHFETAAPEIAQLGQERLERAGLALLGTLRADGSPRISPVEPYLARGHLLLGVMSRSTKARDLTRDPRCVLHSAVSDPDGSDGEFKLYGHALEVEDDETREAGGDAWWVGRPSQDARIFSLSVEQAAFLSWDTEQGEMTVRRWSAQVGVDQLRRKYP